MTKEMTGTIEVQLKEGESAENQMTAFLTKPAYKGAITQYCFRELHEAKSFDIHSAIRLLEDTANQIKSGDLSMIEELFICQAMALNSIFTNSVIQSKKSEYISQHEAYMQIGLKAQNQSRATLQALVQLKQPSNTQFIKQANINQGNQQINNLPEKNNIPQNELLEVNNGYTQLDTGTKTTPTGIDTTLEALGKVHRSKDPGRQKKVSKKLL